MIKGKTRNIEHIIPTLELNAGIHNRFDIEVVDVVTGKVKQKAYAENIILNQLWLYMGTWSGYIYYGSGSGTPAATDTKLFTNVGTVEAPIVSKAYEAGIYSIKRKITLSETVAVGVSISEIGVGTSSKLCTHAMLKDMNGNQITIAKTDTDIINIYATVFLHWDKTMAIKMMPHTYHYNNYDNTTGFFVYLLGGGGVSGAAGFSELWLVQSEYYDIWNIFSKNLTTTWDSTTKKVTCTATRLGANDGNLPGGWRGVLLFGATGSSQYYQYSNIFIPSESLYPGLDIVGEPIATGDGLVKDFVTDFPIASNSKVYVNGIEQTSGITKDEGYPFINTVGKVVFLAPFECIKGEPVYLSTGAPTVGNNTLYVPTNISTGYYENKFTEKIAITKIAKNDGNSLLATAEMSNDLITWTPITLNATIPETYQTYKYMRFTFSGTGASSTRAIAITTNRLSDNNVHFDIAPAVGSVITADYHTSVIAKDINHVFDFSCTIQLGEKII